jgi:hypothetical protein
VYERLTLESKRGAASAASFCFQLVLTVEGTLGARHFADRIGDLVNKLCVESICGPIDCHRPYSSHFTSRTTVPVMAPIVAPDYDFVRRDDIPL